MCNSAMNDILSNSLFFGVAISIVAYYCGNLLKNKFKLAIFNPLLLSIVFIILFLSVFHIDYEVYQAGSKYAEYLLTPATVCLAIPLYQQLNLLKKHKTAIIAGITSGVIASHISILGLCALFHLSHEEYVTLLPKSITTAIGIDLSSELGGYPTITVAIIIITGIIGNMAAPFICKLFKIKEPIAVGLAIGTSSHAMGTAKALELGEIEGAMSSLSIAVAGLMTVLASAVFANFY